MHPFHEVPHGIAGRVLRVSHTDSPWFKVCGTRITSRREGDYILLSQTAA